MYKIRFEDGQEFVINGFGVIGRNPDASAFGENAAKFVVEDVTKTISKTHAAVAVSPEGELLIEDLESTNGTFIEGADMLEQQVLNGAPQILQNGTRARLGDVYFTVQQF